MLQVAQFTTLGATSSAASSGAASAARNGVVGRSSGRREVVQVRATAKDGGGWLESTTKGTTSVPGKVGEFLSGAFQGPKRDQSDDVVVYKTYQFPLKSTLDPKEFGDPTSAIAAHHIEGRLEGLSIEQAVSKKKLFVADYHDAYLPFVERINAQKDAKTYATRALFFLSKDETLKVLVIELALPPKTPGGAKIARVFTPPADSSKPDYLWLTVRAYVANNDIVVHQVLNHLTKCHATMEPIIIAMHRQLSKLHPIHHLMAPHCKSTLEINRAARKVLVNGGGTVESTFTPKAYGMRMAAVNYGDTWTFDSQALPNELIARGMAVPDVSAKHGIRLVVQKWWWEIRNVGHGDKKNAPGWPEMNSKRSLAHILTTIQWIASCLHAALNFGQYAFGGFMPNHPTLTRRLLPDEDTKEWDEMMKNPEKFYLSTISDVNSAFSVTSVAEVLSSHSPAEVYIDERSPNWTEDEQAQAAFKRFSAKLADIDELIKKRNADASLRNRLGPA